MQSKNEIKLIFVDFIFLYYKDFYDIYFPNFTEKRREKTESSRNNKKFEYKIGTG